MIRKFWYFILIVLLLSFDFPAGQEFPAPKESSFRDSVYTIPVVLNGKAEKITDLRPGDILVKVNHNWLPGSAQVYGGKGFGHTALVIQGAQDNDLLELLRRTVIFESNSRDIPGEYQVRKAPAYLPGDDLRFANITFGPQNLGYCYRLRPDLSPEQVKQLIDYVTARDQGISCWRAQKRFTENSGKAFSPQSGYWYCSLLIWQAFYTLFGIDLDPNGGVMVYPNDLISSKYFENTGPANMKRVRF